MLFLSLPQRLEGIAEAKSGIASTTAISSLSVKQQLTMVFGKDSIMLAIARCESHYQQFNPDGSVHRGEKNPLDMGVFQINEKFWLARSKELGFNIYTLDGNIKMAKWIYEHNGTSPWNWSKPCWGLK